jgi:pyruvate ferredoxin oxidoreductase gamma subunit
MSFPSFGAERRGAPVMAFTRISDHPLRGRNMIEHPTILVVLDDSLFNVWDVTEGVKDGAQVLVNTRKYPEEFSLPSSLKVPTLDATSIAMEKLGVPIVNTTMLGALAAVTGLVSLHSLKQAIADMLPKKLVERNIAAAEAGYEVFR